MALQTTAVTRQRSISKNRGMVFRADGCERNNGIYYATAKQQLHCNGGTVFSAPPVPRCYGVG
jgi:hypothetical protein